MELSPKMSRFEKEYERTYKEEDAYSQKNIQELIREVLRHKEAIQKSLDPETTSAVQATSGVQNK